jgi:hypothetical protein
LSVLLPALLFYLPALGPKTGDLLDVPVHLDQPVPTVCVLTVRLNGGSGTVT